MKHYIVSGYTLLRLAHDGFMPQDPPLICAEPENCAHCAYEADELAKRYGIGEAHTDTYSD